MIELTSLRTGIYVNPFLVLPTLEKDFMRYDSRRIIISYIGQRYWVCRW